MSTIITVYSPDKRADAEAYASEIGGYVRDDYNEYGALAVHHDHAEGLRPRIWSQITLPEGAVLRRRSQVNVGDVVISSHNYGPRAVTRVLTQGTPVGTTNLWLEGIDHLEAYPADSLIPVVPGPANRGRPVPLENQEDLVRIARELGVRDDWHEPDEIGVYARVIGDHLDNAMGSTHDRNCGEYNVILTRWDTDQDGEQDVAVVNLATLLSWAARAGETA